MPPSHFLSLPRALSASACTLAEAARRRSCCGVKLARRGGMEIKNKKNVHNEEIKAAAVVENVMNDT